MSNFETSTVNKTKLPFAVLAVSAAALAGCSNDEPEQTPEKSSSNTNRTSGDTTVSNTSLYSSMQFDDLGGNSTIIRVYSDPSANGEASESGTYRDGDFVSAICKQRGRGVSSRPPETSRTSDEWIRFIGGSQVEHYATAVYISKPKEILAELEDC